MNDSKIETLKHILRVRNLANMLVTQFLAQIELHDLSKLESPEAEGFALITEKLKHVKFGSPEYKEGMKEAEEAIAHHHCNNSHHPEYHPRGVNDMTILDVLEMFCDWKAASERNKNGSLENSIHYCCSKYKINPQLEEIFLNSMDIFE